MDGGVDNATKKFNDNKHTKNKTVFNKQAMKAKEERAALRATQIAKNKPSAPSTFLAAKALAYATVLTCSSATVCCIGFKWYHGIESMEDLIWRCKRNVPKQSEKVKNIIVGPLESIRDNMQYVFGALRPSIAPKGSNGDLMKNIENEKAELRALGIDPTWLDSDKPYVKNKIDSKS